MALSIFGYTAREAHLTGIHKVVNGRTGKWRVVRSTDAVVTRVLMPGRLNAWTPFCLVALSARDHHGVPQANDIIHSPLLGATNYHDTHARDSIGVDDLRFRGSNGATRVSCPHSTRRSRSVEPCIALGRPDHRNDESEHESASLESCAVMWTNESL